MVVNSRQHHHMQTPPPHAKWTKWDKRLNNTHIYSMPYYFNNAFHILQASINAYSFFLYKQIILQSLETCLRKVFIKPNILFVFNLFCLTK